MIRQQPLYVWKPHVESFWRYYTLNNSMSMKLRSRSLGAIENAISVYGGYNVLLVHYWSAVIFTRHLKSQVFHIPFNVTMSISYLAPESWNPWAIL